MDRLGFKRRPILLLLNQQLPSGHIQRASDWSHRRPAIIAGPPNQRLRPPDTHLLRHLRPFVRPRPIAAHRRFLLHTASLFLEATGPRQWCHELLRRLNRDLHTVYRRCVPAEARFDQNFLYTVGDVLFHGPMLPYVQTTVAERA